MSPSAAVNDTEIKFVRIIVQIMPNCWLSIL